MTPAIQVENIEVPAIGGHFSVDYTVTKPIKGVLPTVTPENTEWVSNFTVDEQTISFDVIPNFTSKERELSVEINYPGVIRQSYFTIIQACDAEGDFVIMAKDIEPTSFLLDIYPKDKEMAYLLFAVPQAYLDNNGLTTDEAIYQDDIAYIKSNLEYGASIDEYCIVGDKLNISVPTTPATNFVAYCYGIDKKTLERLTDIYYCRLTTPAVEMVEATFDIQTTVKGHKVEAVFTPQNYDGYYYFEALETAFLNPETPLYEVARANFSYIVSYYQSSGYSIEEILQGLCLKGESDFIFELAPEREYTILAYAVNDAAVVCSNPSVKVVTTGPVEPSDNILTISVTDIQARSAQINVTPSNNDPYVIAVEEAEKLKGMTDDEIVNHINLSYYPMPITGETSGTVTPLLPGTEFVALAYGYMAGSATTELFMYSFKTPEAILGDVTFKLEYEKYYDITAVANLDPQYESFEKHGDAFLPVTVMTDPEVTEYYYCVFNYPESYLEMSDAALQNYLYKLDISYPSLLYTFNYDQNLAAFGFAIDENGNWGPLWRSGVFTLSPDGVSDPQEFIDKNSSTASVMTSFTRNKTSEVFPQVTSMRYEFKNINTKSASVESISHRVKSINRPTMGGIYNDMDIVSAKGIRSAKVSLSKE